MSHFDMAGNSNKQKRLEEDFDRVAVAPEKNPNTVMRLQGVDHSPAVQGKIDFGKLRAKEQQ